MREKEETDHENEKAAAAFLALTMTASMLAGCGNNTEATQTTEETKQETEAEPVDVNVTALKGPTAMGMVRMMDESDKGEIDTENYHFNIAASIDEVTPAISQGKTDIAAVPANVASVLYNKTEGDVKVLAINTLGVLYIVENGDSIQSAADLKGKTIYASGKGATPEYALNYILEQNGIDPAADVTIEWKSEHSECVAALAQDAAGIAMLPQPFVTTAMAKNPNGGMNSMAGMGMQMSAGMAFGGMMAGQMNGGVQGQSGTQKESFVICPKCGSEMKKGLKFCSECGASLAVQKKKCIKCGAEINADMKFCPECGHKNESYGKWKAEAEAAEAARRAAREAEQAEREARKSAQAAPAEVYETTAEPVSSEETDAAAESAETEDTAQ